MRRIGVAVVLTVSLALSSVAGEAQEAPALGAAGLRWTSNPVHGRGCMIHQRSCRTTKGVAP